MTGKFCVVNAFYAHSLKKNQSIKLDDNEHVETIQLQCSGFGLMSHNERSIYVTNVCISSQ